MDESNYITRGRNRNALTSIHGEIVEMFEKSIKFRMVDGETVRIPKAAIHEANSLQLNIQTIAVRDWWLQDKENMRRATGQSQSHDPDWRDVKGEFVGNDDDEILATEKAVCWCTEDDVERWIPRSQIEGGENVEDDEERTTLRIKGWFCDKEGI